MGEANASFKPALNHVERTPQMDPISKYPDPDPFASYFYLLRVPALSRNFSLAASPGSVLVSSKLWAQDIPVRVTVMD